MRRLRRLLLVAAAVLGVLVLGAAPAFAHGGEPPGVVSVAQTLGPHELTVTMYLPADGAGPMPVRIVTQGTALDAPMLLRAVPSTGPGAGTPTSRAVVTPGAGAATTSTLQIDRPGAWEVVLIGRSDAVARIPISVPAPAPTPLWAWLVRVGLVVAAVGAIGAAAVWSRRRRVAAGLGATAVVGAAMAATAAVLSSSVVAPASVAPAHAHGDTAMAGMDMAGTDMADAAVTPGSAGGAVVVSPSAARAADGSVEVGLRVTDGASGAPVDDLVVHDDALMHLAVIGPGSRLWHVHPVRVAPGRFAVRLPLPGPGRYGMFAEVVRASGGHQLARSAFTLDGAPTAPEPSATGGSGPREVAGMRVDVSVGRPVAGVASRVGLAFSENGQPVRDLQAWLGMGGHLMVLGPAGAAAAPDPVDPAVSFAHVHDVDPPVQYGYGPDIGFTYAFPTGGRYQLWAQVQRDWRLITIPITVDVAPPAPGT
jgi:hypothetical protein